VPTAPAPTINALKIVADQQLLDVGSDLRLRAVATLTDGSTLNLTNDLKWSSSDSAIADVAPDGVVTAVSAGDATITLSWNSLTTTSALRSQQTRPGVFVRGRVRDFQTRASLGGVPVQFNGFGAVTTNVDGVYSVWLDAQGATSATASSSHHEVIVTPARFDGDLLVDQGRTCVGRYGHILDESTGQPISGAVVSLVGRQTTTAADGSYRIEVTCAVNTWGFNTTLISVSRPGYAQGGRVVGRGVSNVQRLDLTLTRSGQ
jgi:hypothetical protein